MRPKIISLLAVSALALVGCSSAEPDAAPKATAPPAQESPTATASASAKPTETANPNAQLEEQFVGFAEMRGNSLGQDSPKDKVIVDSLHDFCENDESINVFDFQDLNQTLESVADTAYCDQLQ